MLATPSNSITHRPDGVNSHAFSRREPLRGATFAIKPRCARRRNRCEIYPSSTIPAAAAISRLLDRGAPAIAPSTSIVRRVTGIGEATRDGIGHSAAPEGVGPRPRECPASSASAAARPRYGLTMNDISHGASSTSTPPSPLSSRVRMTEDAADEQLGGQLRLAHDLRDRLRAPVIHQHRQHAQHTLLAAKRRGVLQRRFEDEQATPPRLILKKPEQCHQAGTDPIQPALLTPSRLLDRLHRTRETLLKCRREALLSAPEDLRRTRAATGPRERPPSVPDGGYCRLGHLTLTLK